MGEVKTRFGSLENILRNKEGKIIAEVGIFEREGRDHSHEDWEICFIQSGEGEIIVGDRRHRVRAGQTLAIPPRTGHWMIPNGPDPLKILIVYTPEFLAQPL